MEQYPVIGKSQINKFSLKIKCVFNKQFIDETTIYRIATEKSKLRNNRIISIEQRDGKKVYIFENSIDIVKYIDKNNFLSIEEMYNNLQKNIRVFDFMKEHKITFRYACIIIDCNYRIKKLFSLTTSFNINNENIKMKYNGLLKEGVIYSGIYVNDICESDYFSKAIDSFNFDIKVLA
jgi:hypothetical protein